MAHNLKSKFKSRDPRSEHDSHDSEGRMNSPVAGNPSQRKNQVQSIANGVFSDKMERDEPKTGDDITDGNYQSEADEHQSPVHHSHTVHDHTTGQSTTHTVKHGEVCPECGAEYMGG